MSQFRTALSVLGAVFLLAWIPVAAAATSTALVVAIDSSGSIDQTEFDLQKQAYVNYFANNAAGFAGADVAVTVVYWAGEGVQQQVVNWTTLNSATDATNFANAINATVRPDISAPNAAQTGVARALDFSVSLFQQQNFGSADLVLDISGDGTENLDFGTPSVLDTVMIDIPGIGLTPLDVQSGWGTVFASRQAALNAGVLINTLPIIPVPPVQAVEVQDSSPAINQFPAPTFMVNNVPVDISAEWAAALTALGYDSTSLLELFYGRVAGSPDSRIPLTIVANGFTAQELGDKISLKLSQELGVPEPGMGLLLSVGLLTMVFRSRRSA
jgi:hypothetical protein